MSRDLGATNAAQVVAPTLYPVYFAEMQFASGTVRAWNGVGNITVFGNVFSGVGHFGGCESISESGDLAPANVTLTLSGVPSDLISTALSDAYRGRFVFVWIGFMSGLGGSLLATPYQIFGGRMDTMVIDDSGDTSTISINCENMLTDLNRPRTSRWTNEEQQRLFPGDRGLEYIATLPEKPLNWGLAPVTTAPATGSIVPALPRGMPMR